MSLYRTTDRRAVKHKPRRVNARPDDHRFGQGLTFWTPTPTMAPGFSPPAADDEAWLASQAFGSREVTNEEWDRMADEAAWADAYENGQIVNERCLMCQQPSKVLTFGHCDRCCEIMERDGSFEDEPDAPDADPAIRFAGIASLSERRKA